MKIARCSIIAILILSFLLPIIGTSVLAAAPLYDTSTYVVDTEVKNVPAETTIADFLANFNSRSARVYTSDKIMVSSGNVCTGYLFYHRTVDYIPIIVNGDVDCNGLSNSSDYLSMKKSLIGTITLTKDGLKAADTNGDGKLTVTDYLMQKLILLGKYDPNNKPAEELAEPTEEEQHALVSLRDPLIAARPLLTKGANSDYVPLNYETMKAMWLSQFDMDSLYRNGSVQRSESDYRALVKKVISNVKSIGFNTVIVQVRPNADSFYPSMYYSWSSYVTGSYATYGSYDPFKILIELAHAEEISVQAWINPMRGMSPTNANNISTKYPMGKWAKDRTTYGRYLYSYDSIYYLNIAIRAVRNLIINGAAEIVRYYDVDGVHMDDYFYPSGIPDDFDSIEYNAQKTYTTLSKYRVACLSALVSGIYSAIKAENKNVIFGISPAGNLNTVRTKHCADVDTWCSTPGYLDYIMPQDYFGMEHETWSFPDTYERWEAICNPDIVKMMVGISFGKAVSGSSGEGDPYAGSGGNEWIDNKDVIKKCMTFLKTKDSFTGFAIFCYQYLFAPNGGGTNGSTITELKNALPVMNSIDGSIKIKY